MADLPDLVVKIKADLKQLLADLGAAEAAVDGFGEKAKQSGSKAKGAFKETTTEAEKFDQLVTKAGRDGETAFQTVTRRVNETKTALEDMRRKVASGQGGGSLFGDLKAAERDLGKLESYAKTLAEKVVKDTTKAGENAGKSFGEQFAESFQGTPIMPILIAAAAEAAPLIIGMLGAAVSVAFGAGFVALGIVAAMHDPRVQDAVKQLGQVFHTIGGDISQIFAGPVRGAIGDIIKQFSALRPEIRAVFFEASKLVQPLESALMGIVRGALPGVQAALHNLQPLFDYLATKGPQIGKAIGDFFQHITENSAALQQSLGLLINIFTGAIELTGRLIQGSEMLTAAIIQEWQIFFEIIGKVFDLLGKIPIFGSLFRDLAGSMHGAADAIQGFRDGAQGAAGPAQTLGNTVYNVALQVLGLSDDIQGNIDKINAWTDAQYAAGDALLRMHKDLTAFQQALKTNKHNWDLNTVSGQNLYGAFLKAAEGINAYYEPLEKAQPANQNLIQAQLKSEKALYAQAKAAGATKAELDPLKKSIEDLEKQLDKLKSKTITVRVNYTHYGSPGSGPSAAAQGGVRYMAQGGIDYAGASGMYGQLATFADSGIYSGGGQASLVKFAEPSTGGEAYIARNGDRGRQWGAIMTALGWMAERSPGSTSAMTINNSYGGSGGAGGDIAITVPVVLDGRTVARSQVVVNQRQLMRTGTSGQA